MALESQPQKNKYGHGVFGDVSSIIKEMEIDHPNSTFDFQFQFPPIAVSLPQLSSMLPSVQILYYLYPLCMFPVSEFSGL